MERLCLWYPKTGAFRSPSAALFLWLLLARQPRNRWLVLVKERFRRTEPVPQPAAWALGQVQRGWPNLSWPEQRALAAELMTSLQRKGLGVIGTMAWFTVYAAAMAAALSSAWYIMLLSQAGLGSSGAASVPAWLVPVLVGLAIALWPGVLPWLSITIGQRYMKAGRLEHAWKCFDRAVRQGASAASLALRGLTLIDLGRPAEALADLRRARSLGPEIWQLEALCEAALGHAQAAADILARVEEAGPLTPELRLVRAKCFFQMGQYEAACQDYVHASPRTTIGERVNEAGALGLAGHHQAALQLYDSISLDPLPPPQQGVVLSNRAEELFHLERFEEAAVESRRALGVAPTMGEPHAVLALVARQGSDWPAVLRHSEDALARRDNLGWALECRAQALEHLNRGQEAREAYLRFIQVAEGGLFENDVDERLTRARAVISESQEHGGT